MADTINGATTHSKTDTDSAAFIRQAQIFSIRKSLKINFRFGVSERARVSASVSEVMQRFLQIGTNAANVGLLGKAGVKAL